MVTARAALRVDVRPSPFAAVFHRLLTRPVIDIDGQDHVGKWGPAEICVAPGVHRISVYFRYRGQRRARLGESSMEFSVGPATRRVEIEARLGPLNSDHFRITQAR
jgi:hypothetical protein